MLGRVASLLGLRTVASRSGLGKRLLVPVHVPGIIHRTRSIEGYERDYYVSREKHNQTCNYLSRKIVISDQLNSIVAVAILLYAWHRFDQAVTTTEKNNTSITIVTEVTYSLLRLRSCLQHGAERGDYIQTLVENSPPQGGAITLYTIEYQYTMAWLLLSSFPHYMYFYLVSIQCTAWGTQSSCIKTSQ